MTGYQQQADFDRASGADESMRERMAAPRKSRPVLFSRAMALAILAGNKSQTRRVLSPQPPPVESVRRLCGIDYSIFTDHHWPEGFRVAGPVGVVRELMGGHPAQWVSPYGMPGDLLWVREEHYRFGHWERVEGVCTAAGQDKWRFVADSDEVLFDAPGAYRKARHRKDPATPAWHKRLARFMPKAVSRITLEVASVRVERLQDISDADCLAEGVDGVTRLVDLPGVINGAECICRIFDPRQAFFELWRWVNGEESWDANPFVWIIEFKRLEKVS